MIRVWVLLKVLKVLMSRVRKLRDRFNETTDIEVKLKLSAEIRKLIRVSMIFDTEIKRICDSHIDILDRIQRFFKKSV